MVGWESRNGLLDKENYENVQGEFFISFIFELREDNIHQMLIKNNILKRLSILFNHMITE